MSHHLLHQSYWDINSSLSYYLLGSWSGISSFSIINKTTGTIIQMLKVSNTWTVNYNTSTGSLYWVNNFLIVSNLKFEPNDWNQVQVDCALYNNIINYISTSTIIQYHIYKN